MEQVVLVELVQMDSQAEAAAEEEEAEAASNPALMIEEAAAAAAVEPEPEAPVVQAVQEAALLMQFSYSTMELTEL